MITTDCSRANEIERTLECQVHHALEVMCFSEAERLPCLPSIDTPLEATIDFGGAHTGFLRLEIEPAAARSLAAAFLGVEAGNPSLAAQTSDMIHELARVLCGRVLTTLDSAAPFEMRQSAPDLLEPRETIRQAFRVSAGNFRITLQIS